MKGRFAKKVLTENEKKYIRKNYQKMSVRTMAHDLELTYHNVAGFLKEEGLKRTEFDHNIKKRTVRMERNGFFNYAGH